MWYSHLFYFPPPSTDYPLKNAFWDIQFSDPHSAITFDEMHVNDHGLGGKHFWPQAKEFVTDLPSKAAKQIDDQYVMWNL